MSVADVIFSKVSKQYSIKHLEAQETGASWLSRTRARWHQRAETFWALRDVSFEVGRGEAVGIIGHNGAGKSTVLKLLSRITTPTQGDIVIAGRLSAMIEVGSGFHPELTGRENVYLSGTLLGMRRREITRKLESIIDFAGVREFIDTPVKRYSSGMYVRLGFAIAAHLEPQILLLDEVLAVGDAAFQAKCLQRVQELERAGTTIVFISHDLRAVERLCRRVLVLQRGELVFAGPPRQASIEYERQTLACQPMRAELAPRDVLKAVELTGLDFLDGDGRPVVAVRTGEPIRAKLSYVVHRAVDQLFFEIFFVTNEGRVYCQFRTDVGGESLTLQPGEGVIELTCDALGMQPGVYTVDAKAVRHVMPVEVDFKGRCAMLRVEPGAFVHGDFYMPHRWRFTAPHDDAAMAAPVMETRNRRPRVAFRR